METMMYIFCAYLPIHLLAYLPFFDLLRFGKGWMAATVAGNMALHLLGVGWAMAAGRPELVTAVGMAMEPPASTVSNSAPAGTKSSISDSCREGARKPRG